MKAQRQTRGVNNRCCGSVAQKGNSSVDGKVAAEESVAVRKRRSAAVYGRRITRCAMLFARQCPREGM